MTVNFYKYLPTFFLTLILFLTCSCFNLNTKTLIPGSDIDVLRIYKKEIAILKDNSIKNNTRKKYEAAKTIIDNVDLYQIYDYEQVENIFGESNMVGHGLYKGTYIVYQYAYADKLIQINFWVRDRIVVKTEVRSE